MVQPLQSSELRKHPLVRLYDLLHTEQVKLLILVNLACFGF